MSDIQGIEQIDALKTKLMRWASVAPKEVEKVLRIGAEMVRKEAQVKHLSGPRMPRGMGDETNATLYSSEPHHPFYLRKSIAIRVHVKPGEIQAEVGTPVHYGRKHELGIGVPKRPFLRPSLQHEHKGIFEMIDKAWFQAYGK